MELVHAIAYAWFCGLAGLVLGVIVGMRTERTTVAAFVTGLLLGVAAGGVLSLEIIREVAASSSSTAGIGMLLVPFPPITNAIGGIAGAVLVRAWRVARAANPDGSHGGLV